METGTGNVKMWRNFFWLFQRNITEIAIPSVWNGDLDNRFLRFARNDKGQLRSERQGRFARNDKGHSAQEDKGIPFETERNDKESYTLKRKCMMSPSWTT